MKKILWILPLLILAGCGDTVHRDMLSKAAKFCGTWENISRIETTHVPIIDWVEAPDSVRVICVDGKSSYLSEIK